MTTVLGLDVGGTNSRARLVRDDELVGEASGPSASLAAAGRERAAVAMAAVLEELGLRPGVGLDAVCIGTAGTSARESEAFLVELLAPLTSTGRVVLVNDAAAGAGGGRAHRRDCLHRRHRVHCRRGGGRPGGAGRGLGVPAR